MENLLERFTACKDRIAKACKQCGRDPSSIRMLAVSKGQSSAQIRELYAMGQRAFAENYAQELEQKALELSDLDIAWVYIGALQSRKIPILLEAGVKEIQTVSSFKQAQMIAREQNLGKPFPIYIQVNAGEEEQKQGVEFSKLQDLTQEIRKLPELSLQGIMAIPPQVFADSDPSLGLPLPYQKLSEYASSVGLGLLSLGMSQDLELAIAAGSTCVRIGTKLFGPRP